MANHFDEIKFLQVPREENTKANEIARIVSSKQQTHHEGLMIKVQMKPSIEEIQALQVDSHPFIHPRREVTRRS